MPKGIGRRAIGPRTIATRQIAKRYGQGLGGSLAFYVTTTNTPTTYQPGIAGIVYLYAMGAGAGGASAGTTGGGGAATGFAAVRIGTASTITHQGVPTGGPAATNGGDLVVVIDGRTFTAGGGKASGLGGMALGFDIARNGGASGVSPTNGGTAGALSGSNQGGGGAGGFGEQNKDGASANPINAFIGTGGAGNNAGNGGDGTAGCGGGSGSGTGGAGGAGRLFFMIVQDVAP